MQFHYHFLINPTAGSGSAEKIVARIIDIASTRGFPYTTYYTQFAGHEQQIAQDLAKETLIPWKADNLSELDEDTTFPLLVVIGGDGTLHQVVNAFYHLAVEIPVAYVPAGSGNDFARGIGLPKEAEKAFWQIVKTPFPREVSLIAYDEKIQEERGVVMNNVGIGLDAAIVHATNDSATKKRLNKYNLGSLAYIASIIKVLFMQKGFPIMVDINGQQKNFAKAFLCTTTNHPYFGGGVAIAPTANAEKNQLDFVLVERINLFKIFWLIILLLQKKQMNSKYFHHFTANKLRIVSTMPQYGQADGEVMGSRSFDIYFSMKKQWIWC
ncbi:diacylglycerol kinase [Enterococcus sp. JM4C]|uniref:diacylglycerol/lipid kinase family protein n=1 Tax=Candidatus Enterococcus huntleyi TaxID=1857217 RepID=UPI001379E19A|nr:diacylglycerol kinase family protein [Enterococcus sp. JM4C]KAF1296400.1 diacylglycerol kinase [Enterococcus sp. JM4C]